MATQTVYFNNPADITELQDESIQYSILPEQSRRPDFSQLSQTGISGLPQASFSLYDIGRQFTQITNALYAKLDDPVVAAQIDYLCQTGGSYGYAYAVDWCCNVMHAALTGPDSIVAGATGYTARLVAINTDGNCLFNARGGTWPSAKVAPVGLETFFPRATGTDATIVDAYSASSPVFIYLTGAYQAFQGSSSSFVISTTTQAVPLLDIANAPNLIPFLSPFLTVSSTGVPADWTYTRYSNPNRILNDTWVNNHQQRNAFSAVGVNGIGTDIRYNSTGKGFYNLGLAAKIPLKTATSDNGGVSFLARLLWSKAI
jgi:hypothetical protein